MSYLYGASIQGIQDFIFKSNKLKEIVGASELIKKISEDFKAYEADEILVNAAGNIKAIFHSKDKCEKAVSLFSKQIEQQAYGVTISQAVVSFEGKQTQGIIDELEKRLKVQRNRPSMPLDLSLNIMKLNPTTAKPLVNKDGDKATLQKLEAYQNIEKDETYKDLKHISNVKNKLAVIHIDGNGLGEVIRKIGTSLSSFSLNLDAATKKAFERAKVDKAVREIILGGDDITVICKSDDALAFTNEFLEFFEKETEEVLGYKLTACAGIAYCNEKYPFHYAVTLAEELCTQTKKRAKLINEVSAPSSLMFHNIQSSNFQSWEKFIEDELTITNDKEEIRLDFGPYYISEASQPLIKNFIVVVESLRLKDSPSSKLRSWLSELYKSSDYAQSFLERVDSMADINPKYSKAILNKNLKSLDTSLKLNRLLVEGTTPIYDVLQIISITEAR